MPNKEAPQIEEDKAPVAVPEKHSSEKHVPQVVLPAVFGVAVFVGLVYFLVLAPRMKTVQLGKLYSANISPVRANVGKVGQALSNMYRILSGNSNNSSEGEMLLRLDTRQFTAQLNELNLNLNAGKRGEVAGVSTVVRTLNGKAVSEQIDQAAALLKKMSPLGNFGELQEKVLGQTTVESPIINQMRLLKNEAMSGTAEVEKSRGLLTKLTGVVLTAEKAPKTLAQVSSDLGANNKEANVYLDESSKTTSYYQKLTDINIRLVPMLSSYLLFFQQVASTRNPTPYLPQLDEIESTFKDLNKEILAINTNTLPEGINDLHKDNLKVMEIIGVSITQSRSAIKALSLVQFIGALSDFEQKLSPLTMRATTLELNFWQNNKALASYKELVGYYDATIKKAGEVKENNNYFLLPLLGVK